MYKIALFCASLALLTACGDNGAEKVSQEKVETPMQGQVDAMEKAKNVENVMQDAAAQQQQTMEQQENAAPAVTSPATGE